MVVSFEREGEKCKEEGLCVEENDIQGRNQLYGGEKERF